MKRSIFVFFLSVSLCLSFLPNTEAQPISDVFPPPIADILPCEDINRRTIQIGNQTFVLVRNRFDLDLIRQGLTLNYYLCNDIDLNTVVFLPIGNATNSFSGIFEGNNHQILNLTINSPGADFVALFGGINGAEIRNVSLVNFNMSGNNRVGTLVGYARLSTIRNAHGQGVVTGARDDIGGLAGYTDQTDIFDSSANSLVSGRNHVGGLVGYFDVDGDIEDSSALGDVSGNAQVGGLVGFSVGRAFFHIDIKRSFARGNVTGTFIDIGGFIGQADDTSVQESYSNGDVSGGTYVGGFVGSLSGSGSVLVHTYTNGFVNGTSSVGSYVGRITSSSALGSVARNDGINSTLQACGLCIRQPGVQRRGTNAMKQFGTYTALNWSIRKHNQAGNTTWVIADPDGSEYPRMSYENPTYANCTPSAGFIPIRNAEGIDDIRYSGLSGQYFLCNDVDMNNSRRTFQPIGDSTTGFTGQFDGDNKVIDNLTINLPNNRYVGLFGYIDTATIKNVGLTSVNITAKQSVGSLVGIDNSAFANRSTISDVTAQGNVTGSDFFVGGLIGEGRQVAITNAGFINGNVTGKNFVGGVIGSMGGTSSINYSYSRGRVTCQGSFGGNIGGLVGSMNGSTLSNSFSAGVVIGTSASHSNLGGLIGGADSSTINNCYAMTSVTKPSSTTTSTSGLINTISSNTTVTDCYSTGFVGSIFPQGLVGRVFSGSTVTNSYWDTQTSGTNQSGGGLGRTTAEMTTLPRPSNTYVNWDFFNQTSNPNGEWDQNTTTNFRYPFLRNNNN